MAISRDLPIRASLSGHRTNAHNAKTYATVGTLGALLGFLILTEINDPGGTRYLRYMVAQTVFALVVLVACNAVLNGSGGVSWLAHGVVITNIWVDCLGNAAGLYARYVDYDKITHFLGGAMLTVLAADVIRGGCAWRNVTFGRRHLAIAVAVSLSLGGMWEVYEYLGDVLFHTVRHDGSRDTTFDLVMDAAGSVAACIVIGWARMAWFSPNATPSRASDARAQG